jgi:hypothetical protein
LTKPLTIHCPIIALNNKAVMAACVPGKRKSTTSAIHDGKKSTHDVVSVHDMHGKGNPPAPAKGHTSTDTSKQKRWRHGCSSDELKHRAKSICHFGTRLAIEMQGSTPTSPSTSFSTLAKQV